MKNRPIIGISATLLTAESGVYLGLERACVINNYIEAVRLSGGIPIILPVIEGNEMIEAQVDLIDGLLLSGGYDITPSIFGEEPALGLEATHPARDIYEISLLQSAAAKEKPILGICRGIQLINVAFGGTLFQDLPSSGFPVLQHFQKTKYSLATHLVKLLPQSKLRKIFGKESLFTNSFHHQSVKEIAPGFVISAQTSDGVIEGIESQNAPFLMGVQWHPEVMCPQTSGMQLLFSAFIEAAKWRRSR